MTEPTVHVVTDVPAKKIPFYLNKTYIKTVAAATAVAGVAYVVHKKGYLPMQDVVTTATPDAINIAS